MVPAELHLATEASALKDTFASSRLPGAGAVANLGACCKALRRARFLELDTWKGGVVLLNYTLQGVRPRWPAASRQGAFWG